MDNFSTFTLTNKINMNYEFKGTKTEWEIKLGSRESFSKILIDANKIIKFEYKVSDYKSELYDAQLISCAPEMLDMLCRVRDYAEENGMQYSLHTEIEQLIKKATTIND